MKINQKLLSLMLACGLLVISSCDGSEESTAEEEFLRKLSGTWALRQVQLNGMDMTDYFPDMTLTVNADETYSVLHPVSPIWPAGGTYTLQASANADLFDILRSDGVLITVTELSGNMLRYTVPYESASGRMNEISGDYEFTMER